MKYILQHKGRHQQKKNVFFRALPESPKPHTPDPNSGNMVLFFTSKTTFCAYDRKKIDADIEGCNDNHDDNYGNFDDNYDKND